MLTPSRRNVLGFDINEVTGKTETHSVHVEDSDVKASKRRRRFGLRVYTVFQNPVPTKYRNSAQQRGTAKTEFLLTRLPLAFFSARCIE